MQELAGAAMHTIRQPFAIETFGMFRNMMLSGDFTPKVQLIAVMAKHPPPASVPLPMRAVKLPFTTAS